MSSASNLDWFVVYDNRTNRVVCEGTYQEVEDYIENPGRYTVVMRANGVVVN